MGSLLLEFVSTLNFFAITSVVLLLVGNATFGILWFAFFVSATFVYVELNGHININIVNVCNNTQDLIYILNFSLEEK